jgi:hypothetical protein
LCEKLPENRYGRRNPHQEAEAVITFTMNSREEP